VTFLRSSGGDGFRVAGLQGTGTGRMAGLAWRKSPAAHRRGLPGIDGMLDWAHLGAALGPGQLSLQAAGGMWHRAATPLVYAVVFGKMTASGS
jgi:hypothetical protein